MFRIIGILVGAAIMLTGCDNKSANNVDVNLASESTKQSTITTVQNNTNEIIDKNYEYILENLGVADITEYHVNVENIDYDMDSTLEAFNQNHDVKFVYKKDSSTSEAQGALQIEMKNNKITNVTNSYFDKIDFDLEDVSEDTDLVIKKYEQHYGIDNEDIDIFNQRLYSDELLAEIQDNIMFDIFKIDENKRVSICSTYEDNDEFMMIYSKNNVSYKLELISKNDIIDSISKELNIMYDYEALF